MKKRESGDILHAALQVTRRLADLTLTEEDLCVIETVVRGDGPVDLLWRLDHKIGGVGGYCLPIDLVCNPFQGTLMRALFRPLQYARFEIEREGFFSGTDSSPRYVVEYCGMHMEGVFKVLFWFCPLLRLRISKPLGILMKRAEAFGTLSPEVIECVDTLRKLYNKSKHDVNLEDHRPRLFSAWDALVAYVAARRLGREILSLMPDRAKGRVLGEYAAEY